MLKHTTLPTKSRQDNRGIWRIGASDVEDYISQAYRRTAEKIEAGGLPDDDLG